MSEAATRSITVLGAGIVGVCCALSLQRDGFSVCLIDRGEPGCRVLIRQCRHDLNRLNPAACGTGHSQACSAHVARPRGTAGRALATSPEVDPVAARIRQKREAGKSRGDHTCPGSLAGAGQRCLSGFGGGHAGIRPLSVPWRALRLSQRCSTGDACREVRHVARPWHRLRRNPWRRPEDVGTGARGRLWLRLLPSGQRIRGRPVGADAWSV